MNRIIWLDKLKAVAIFLVIWGHIIINCISYEQKYRIAGLIYSIHIPLFLIISGILVNKKSIKDTIKNVFNKFLIPYVSWCMILSAFYIGMKLFQIELLGENLTIITEGIFHNFLWFIKAYVISYLLYQFLPFNNIIKCLSGLTLLFIANIVYINNSNLAELFSLSLYTYSFFSIATVFKKKITNVHLYGVMFLLLFLLLVPFATWQNNYFVASFKHIYDYNEWYIYIVRLLLGFSISVALISLKDIPPLNFETITSKIGKETLSIYMLQSLLVEAVLPRIITIDKFPIGIVYSFLISICMLFICYYCVILLKRIKFVNMILFGF